MNGRDDGTVRRYGHEPRMTTGGLAAGMSGPGARTGGTDMGNGTDAMESLIMRAMDDRGLAARRMADAHDARAPMRREEAIAAAVTRGLPRRVTLWSTLTQARGSMRPRDLFFGAWDCVAAALVMTAVVWIWPFLQLVDGSRRLVHDPGMVYAMAFLASPFLYEATHLLVRWRERERGTDDLLRAMRWSFVRLCALRMLVVGAAASMLIVAYGLCANAALSAGPMGPSVAMPDGSMAGTAGRSLASLLGVAFSALFLFGIAQLAADVHLRWPWSMIVVPATWAALCAAMIAWSDRFAMMLTRIPPFVALVAAVMTGTAYLAALSRFVRRSPAVVLA